MKKIVAVLLILSSLWGFAQQFPTEKQTVYSEFLISANMGRLASGEIGLGYGLEAIFFTTLKGSHGSFFQIQYDEINYSLDESRKSMGFQQFEDLDYRFRTLRFGLGYRYTHDKWAGIKPFIEGGGNIYALAKRKTTGSSALVRYSGEQFNDAFLYREDIDFEKSITPMFGYSVGIGCLFEHGLADILCKASFRGTPDERISSELAERSYNLQYVAFSVGIRPKYKLHW
jgi:hypothetical protein